MEQGVVTWLKEHNNKIAGRNIEFFSADTGGNPAGTKTKVQELVERDKVDTILGPLAAFELLAITDYIAQSKFPLLSLAAAEDMTQRRPNPYFIRASATSAQAMHPMADYAAKELKLNASSASPKTSPSATSRWAASSRPSKTMAARSSRRFGRRWSRRTIRRMSRKSPIATASARASPARTRCAS